MASSTMALLTLIVLLLVSFMPRHTIQLKPSCISQIAVANQACALVPMSVASVDLNHTRVHAISDDDDDDDNGNDDGDEETEHPHRGEHGNGRGQRHGNGHGQRHGNGHGGGHGNGHRRRHRSGHGHGGGHSETPRAIVACCQWVEDVEELCVCAAFLRLPAFLVKLNHAYTVSVGNTCSRTFNCPRI